MTDDGKAPRIPAIPTVYTGVRFRSRLEAKWAAMFDLLGWRWAYECLDLGSGAAGYIPDFLVDDTLLVECRPAIGEDWYARAARSIRASGWLDSAVVLTGILRPGSVNPDALVCGVNVPHAEGNTNTPDEVAFAHCAECPGTTLALTWADTTSPRPRLGACLRCGSGDTHELAPGAPGIVTLWREAGNRVQWRAPDAPCPSCGLPAAPFSHRLTCTAKPA